MVSSKRVRSSSSMTVESTGLADLGCSRSTISAMSHPFPAADASSPKVQKFSGPPEMGIDKNKRYTATIDTSMGQMIVALDPLKAPKTVNSFVFLARYRYYEGIIFHRVIQGFVLQGGDPTGTGSGGPGYRFDDELPRKGEYELGSLAMANSGPNTNGSQFFVISGPSGMSLPPSYSLFGKVVKGLDVVEAIQNVPTARGDRPVVDVVINSITITEAD